MAMTTDKIRAAFAACRALMPAYIKPERGGSRWAHLIFMCEEGSTFAADRREKAMRWLGFVQGALWTLDAITIENLKSVNRSDEPQGCNNPGWCGVACGCPPLKSDG